MNELIKSSELAERVRTQIKQSIIDIVPTEKWDKLIEKTISEFVEVELPGIIKTEARQRFLSFVREYLSSPDFNREYSSHGKIMAGKAVDEILKRSAPELLSAMMGGIVQSVVDSVKYEIQSSLGQQY